jgi:hypothetical protein
MTSLNTTLSTAFSAHARAMSANQGISSSLTAARARLATRRLERQAFASLVTSIWRPETITQSATVAAPQDPTKEEMDPEERRWALEWERRNVED